MAEQKDDPGQAAKLTQSRRATQAGAAAEPLTAQNGTAQDRVTEDDRSGSRTGTADKNPATVVRRKQRYLIGLRSLPGIASLPSDPFLERLGQMDGVEITRRLKGRGLQAAGMTPIAGAPAAAAPEVVVAHMDEQRGEALRLNAPPHVIVEIDAPLGYSDIAITDSSGQASLQTHAVDGSGIHAVYVRPAADHWERYIQNPSLEPGQVNVIRLNPLDRTSGSFPGEP